MLAAFISITCFESQLLTSPSQVLMAALPSTPPSPHTSPRKWHWGEAAA